MITNNNAEIARKNWLRASKDLGFEIKTPHSIKVNDVEMQIFAFLPQLGSPNGMLLGLTSPPEFKTDPELVKLAEKLGMFYSFVNVESVLNYDEKFFEDAIRDWSQ